MRREAISAGSSLIPARIKCHLQAVAEHLSRYDPRRRDLHALHCVAEIIVESLRHTKCKGASLQATKVQILSRRDRSSVFHDYSPFMSKFQVHSLDSLIQHKTPAHPQPQPELQVGEICGRC